MGTTGRDKTKTKDATVYKALADLRRPLQGLEDLGDMCGMCRSTVSASVKRLELAGHVKLKIEKRAITRIVLSASGRAIAVENRRVTGNAFIAKGRKKKTNPAGVSRETKGESDARAGLIGVSMIALTMASCRYPIGERDCRASDLTFCGKDCDGKSSWCAEHRAICTRRKGDAWDGEAATPAPSINDMDAADYRVSHD